MKTILLGIFVACCMTACTVSHTAIVTNNSVGSKVGKIEGTPFKKNLDLSYAGAKKEGDITKVGIAEFKVKMLLIIPKFSVVVTGE